MSSDDDPSLNQILRTDDHYTTFQQATDTNREVCDLSERSLDFLPYSHGESLVSSNHPRDGVVSDSSRFKGSHSSHRSPSHGTEPMILNGAFAHQLLNPHFSAQEHTTTEGKLPKIHGPHRQTDSNSQSNVTVQLFPLESTSTGCCSSHSTTSEIDMPIGGSNSAVVGGHKRSINRSLIRSKPKAKQQSRMQSTDQHRRIHRSQSLFDFSRSGTLEDAYDSQRDGGSHPSKLHDHHRHHSLAHIPSSVSFGSQHRIESILSLLQPSTMIATAQTLSPPVSPPPNAYLRLLVFSLGSLINTMCCFTFAPITGILDSSPWHNTSATQLSLLISVYFILYIIMAIPTSYILSKITIERALITAFCVQAVGASIRVLGHLYPRTFPLYTTFMVGQILCGLIQGFVINTPPLISARWFSPQQRSFATSIGCNSNTLGVATAYLIPYLFIGEHPKRIGRVVIYPAIGAIICAVLSVYVYRDYYTPPTPLSGAGGDGGSSSSSSTSSSSSSSRSSSPAPRDPLLLSSILSDRSPDVSHSDLDSWYQGDQGDQHDEDDHHSIGGTQHSPPIDDPHPNQHKVVILDQPVITPSRNTISKAQPRGETGDGGEKTSTVVTNPVKNDLSPSSSSLSSMESSSSESDSDKNRLHAAISNSPVYQTIRSHLGKGFFLPVTLVFILSEVMLNIFSSTLSIQLQHILPPMEITLTGVLFIICGLISSGIISLFITSSLSTLLTIIIILQTLVLGLMGLYTLMSAVNPMLIPTLMLLLGIVLCPIQPIALDILAIITKPISEDITAMIAQMTGNIASAIALPIFVHFQSSYLRKRVKNHLKHIPPNGFMSEFLSWLTFPRSLVANIALCIFMIGPSTLLFYYVWWYFYRKPAPVESEHSASTSSNDLETGQTGKQQHDTQGIPLLQTSPTLQYPICPFCGHLRVPEGELDADGLTTPVGLSRVEMTYDTPLSSLTTPMGLRKINSPWEITSVGDDDSEFDTDEPHGRQNNNSNPTHAIQANARKAKNSRHNSNVVSLSRSESSSLSSQSSDGDSVYRYCHCDVDDSRENNSLQLDFWKHATILNRRIQAHTPNEARPLLAPSTGRHSRSHRPIHPSYSALDSEH